jgi:hypothetical protein
MLKHGSVCDETQGWRCTISHSQTRNTCWFNNPNIPFTAEFIANQVHVLQLAAIFIWQQYSFGSSIQLAAVFNLQQYSIGSNIQLAAIFNWQQYSTPDSMCSFSKMI